MIEEGESSGPPSAKRWSSRRRRFLPRLKGHRAGDRVELAMREQTQLFVVDRTEIVEANNVEVLRPTNTVTITLVTCYPFYFVGRAPQRYIVTGELSRQAQGGDRKRVGSSK